MAKSEMEKTSIPQPEATQTPETGKNCLYDPSRVEIKLDRYGTVPAAALTDPSLLPTIRDYKRQIASRLYPLSRENIERRIPTADYHVSRKIDGEFSMLIYRDGDLVSINPGATVRVGMPWQSEAKEILAAAGIRQAIIAGELYVTNDQSRRCRTHDVGSTARNPKSSEDLERLRFAVFDLLSIDGQEIQSPYDKVWTQIENLFSKGRSVHPVENVIVTGAPGVARLFDQWVVKEKSEGLVIRSDSAGSFKAKPLHTLDAVVIGFTESIDDRAGMIHDLLLGVARPDGAIHILCRVGGGFSEQLRSDMLTDLQAMAVESEFAEVNSDHVAYQMVEPKWIVEISCLDIISQNIRGGPIHRMVLDWNEDKNRYEVVRRLPLVSVISPQYIRMRHDKSFNTTDVRIAQVTDIVPVEKSNIAADEIKPTGSTLIEREVYTKKLRGKILVRKFVRWKTNKENKGNTDGDFPAYVIHYTDFSPSRKTPLTREVRVSNSETQIGELWDKLKTEKIKKGWKIV